jgi:hypothetical protein
MAENSNTALEKIRAKYQKKETVSDNFGRIIVARRLTTSQQIVVREMAASGDPAVVGILTLAASVESIDGGLFPFPKDRKELNATLDALDDPGLEALSKAYEKFNEITEEESKALAKNSRATDTSGKS